MSIWICGRVCEVGMGSPGKTFRLRTGAKFTIAIGVIGVAAGLWLIHYGRQIYERMGNSPVALAQPYGLIYSALGAFFLLVGIVRIWTGLRAKKKRWFDDPLGKDD